MIIFDVKLGTKWDGEGAFEEDFKIFNLGAEEAELVNVSEN